MLKREVCNSIKMNVYYIKLLVRTYQKEKLTQREREWITKKKETEESTKHF